MTGKLELIVISILEAILMTLAYQVSQNENLHFGISGTLYTSNLDTYSGRGMNVNAGLIYDNHPLKLSISAKNIVSSMKMKWSNSNSQNLPSQLIYALDYSWSEFNFLGIDTTS